MITLGFASVRIPSYDSLYQCSNVQACVRKLKLKFEKCTVLLGFMVQRNLWFVRLTFLLFHLPKIPLVEITMLMLRSIVPVITPSLHRLVPLHLFRS